MLKKHLKIKTVLFIACILLLYMTAMMPVSTHLGVNGIVTEKKIPLYLKMSNFLDRHFQVKYITNEIIGPETSAEKKISKIYLWVINHIQNQPEGLNVMDDHPLHIIIRGYGQNDQKNDIFSLLCTYAGFDSFYLAAIDAQRKKHYFTLVKYRDQWIPFDVCHQTEFFRNDKWASLEDVQANDFQVKYTGHSRLSKSYYSHALGHVDLSVKEKTKKRWRNNLQKPVSRIWHMIRQTIRMI